MIQEDSLLLFLHSIRGQKVDYFPNPGNAGDGLIAYATYELFRRFDILATPHRHEDTVDADIVLIGGGGNLVEGRYTHAADIIRRHPHVQRLVLLPHTIVGYPDVLSLTHKNLSVFCRELVSYDGVLANGANSERTFLSQDMVLYLPDDHFSEFFQMGAGTLRSLREDGESGNLVGSDPNNIDLSLSWNGDLWGSARFSMHVAKSLAAYISRYSRVQTDRMHLAILAGFLKKEVELLPNAYFKSEAVYRHSLQGRFPHVRFVENPAALEPSGEDIGTLDGMLEPTPDRGDGLLEKSAAASAPATGLEIEIAAPVRRLVGRMARTTLGRKLRRGVANARPRLLGQDARKRLERLRFFSQQDYYAMHPDVAAAQMAASEHAMRYGIAENRQIFRPHTIASVLAKVPPPSERDISPLGTASNKPIKVYASSLGNQYMREIAEDLVAALGQAGAPVTMGNENDPMDGTGAARIFVAPHEFFCLGRGREWFRPEVLSTAFLFNTEQVQTPWFTASLPAILGARGILDLSAQNAFIFREAGIPAMHWEPDTGTSENWLEENDWSHPLVKVIQSRKSELQTLEWAKRPIDICFFGGESPRRQIALARYAEPFARFATYIYCRGQNRGPILRDDPLTRIAGFVSSRSRISLNLHRDEFPYFEWHRIVRQGMRSGSVVVSDPCLPHPVWKPGIHFVEENIRHIPNVIDWLLNSEDGRTKAEDIRKNVVERLTGGGNGARVTAFVSQVMGWTR